jgi:hypothetical protein
MQKIEHQINNANWRQRTNAHYVAQQVGIENVFGGLLPRQVHKSY